MVIDQRNAGASVTQTTSNLYTVDRFLINGSVASKFTAEQTISGVAAPSGFTDYLGCTSSSAYSVGSSETFGIQQRIEGFNIADLGWGTANAKTVTLSFQVYSSLTGTFGGALRNSAADRSYPFSYSIPTANTWTTISVTIAGDTTGTWLTTNGIGINVIFSLGTGSTLSGTASAWAAGNFLSATGATSVVGTNGATFYITGVQLEKGTQATSFEYRQYQQELALCQRYYEKSFVIETAPANGANSTSLLTEINSSRGYATGATVFDGFTVQFKVTKRATPSITVFGNSSGQWLLAANTNAGVSFPAIGDSSFSAYHTQSGSVLALRGHWTASIEL
jgi:hypothetical protein